MMVHTTIIFLCTVNHHYHHHDNDDDPEQEQWNRNVEGCHHPHACEERRMVRALRATHSLMMDGWHPENGMESSYKSLDVVGSQSD